MARKPMKKGLRFDVFHRDEFTCQYCGRTPPEVILEADHVLPVAKGGQDEIENLVTSCRDCNSGKSAKDLTVPPINLQEKMAERMELAAQIEAYHQFLSAQRTWEIAAANTFAGLWYEQIGDAPGDARFSMGRIQSLRRFMQYLPIGDIEDAIGLAVARKQPTIADDESAWKYFCGICWSKIKQRKGGA